MTGRVACIAFAAAMAVVAAPWAVAWHSGCEEMDERSVDHGPERRPAHVAR